VKTGNEYADALGPFFADTPKAVFAALAYSYAVRLFETTDPSEIRQLLADEWSALHANGIVPQRPPRAAHAARGI
jgi:hypothetical protein